MVDFHSHILPNVDHGTSSIETSVNQLQLAKKYGITTVVATSHFYPFHSDVEGFLKKRDEAYALLMAQKPDGVDVIKGAEVMLTIDLDKIEGIEKLCIENTNHMLVEMPDMINSTWIYDVLSRLYDRGITPIIAHLDRYPEDVQENLLEMNFPIQVNAVAFKSFFKSRKMVYLAKEQLVHLLGSDIHGANERAYKDFVYAKNKLGASFDRMQKNAKKILGL